MIKFNKDFMFGACTSAEQSEGYRNFKTNWDIFYDKHPEKFFGGVGPSITSRTFNQYKEDIELYSKMGFDSFRTSFSWARLFPSKDVVCQEGVKFYHDYIDALKAKNIKTMFCLNHFDLPAWIMEEGGLENENTAIEFEKFAKLVLDEYGSKLDYLGSFNEPIVPVMLGYLTGDHHWPLVKDAKRTIQAGYVTILCHARFANLFNTEYRNKLQTKIGVIVNITPTLPADEINFTAEDQKAADLYNLIHNYALLDAMCKGEFSPELISMVKDNGLCGNYKAEDLEIIKKTKIDWVGANYYCPSRVVAVDPTKETPDISIGSINLKAYSYKDARMNPFRGWEIKPEMLIKICEIFKNRYDNIPFYISENGMGVEGEEKFRNAEGYIDDQYRIAFIKEHLRALRQGMDMYGVNCFGYHLWASIDCWSWLNAYKNRYGFIEVEIETGKRIMKSSGKWFSDFTKTKEFEDNFEMIEHFISTK
ncbi:MAG: glycoside hydrolase family 1 protein [Mycoplasma sp.]